MDPKILRESLRRIWTNNISMLSFNFSMNNFTSKCIVFKCFNLFKHIAMRDRKKEYRRTSFTLIVKTLHIFGLDKHVLIPDSKIKLRILVRRLSTLTLLKISNQHILLVS